MSRSPGGHRFVPGMKSSSRRKVALCAIIKGKFKMDTMEYDFEELPIQGYGLGVLLYGKAIIGDDGCGEPELRLVILHGGSARIEPPRKGNTGLDATIFTAIEDVLMDHRTDDGLHLLTMWADHMAGESEPDSDYLYEEKRDRQIDF